MPDPASEEVEEIPDEVDRSCEEQHVVDLDDQAKAFLSTFATIRSKVDDLARAESDLKRFELSIEDDRKRLAKKLDSARGALRNARIQMAVELSKLDGHFTKVAELIKEANRA